MFLMSRKIKALGVKMVLSGEGADEVFGGYLYFHKAPNKKALHQETVDKVCLNGVLFSLSLSLIVFVRKSETCCGCACVTRI